MTNTLQLDDDWTASLRNRRASVRDLEARFKNAEQTIRRYQPDEEIGDFPPSAGDIDTMQWGELGVYEVLCQLAVKVIEQRADQLVAEAEEAERIYAENLRQQSMTPQEAEVEALKRAVYHLAARVTKLEGERSARLPALPHVPRTEVPQLRVCQKGWDATPASAAIMVACGRSAVVPPLQRQTSRGRASRAEFTRWT